MNIVNRYHMVWLYLVICTLFSCSENNITGPEKLNEAGFPFKVGNRWQYTVTGKIEQTRLGVVTLTDTTTIHISWSVEAEEEVFGIDAFRLHVVAEHNGGLTDGMVGSEDLWFAMVGDTLRGVALKRDGNIESFIGRLSKRVEPPQDNLDNSGPLNLQGINQNGILPWNANVLVFPIDKGKFWTNYGGTASFGIRLVDLIESVAVPAGTFETWRVTHLFSGSDADNRWQQWFGSSGLIRAEFAYSFEFSIQDENGVFIPNGGVSTFKETLVLESVTLL